MKSRNKQLDKIEEIIRQKLEIAEANAFSRLDILERRIGVRTNPSWSISKRLSIIEKLFDINKSDWR